jgi:hypothetical protein
MDKAPDPVSCAAGCKRTAQDPEKAGWSCLQITSGRWRCGDCERELWQARNMPGTEASYTPDTLPPDSIGALKKLPEPLPLHEKVKP